MEAASLTQLSYCARTLVWLLPFVGQSVFVRFMCVCLCMLQAVPYSHRGYDPETKIWSVDREMLEEVLEKLRAPPVNARIHMPPQVHMHMTCLLALNAAPLD